MGLKVSLFRPFGPGLRTVMRKTSFHIAFYLLFSISLGAQHAGMAENIVPNPGFEMYSSTPIGWFYKGSHFTSVMKYWGSASAASPDVFGPKVRVPAHWADKGFGQQKARQGHSMVGITVYGCEDGKPHCREYIQIQLKEPLVVGQVYHAEFWTTHLPRSLRVNNMGMYFSEEKIEEATDEIIDVKPQVLFTQVLNDPYGNWIKVAGEFTATTEAAYLTIGNFYPDSLLKVSPMNKDQLNYGYYYIDDILVHKKEPILPVPVREDDLSKIKIEEGKLVTLKDIFFDTDKSELLPRSFIELNKLVRLMRENPGMAIEIAGHTDDRGDDRYNMALSRKRAKAVVDYLVRKGISPNRTQYQGFGSAQPIATNSNKAGRQLNRRVTFLVLRK